MSKNVVILQNLADDFSYDTSKLWNDSIIIGVGTPSLQPLVIEKKWLWIDSVKNKITHYWNPSLLSWKLIDENVLSATKLTTARTINGVSFDGTINITLPVISEIVNVTGVTLPITFPITTLTGNPVFTPSFPSNINYLYQITNGTNIVFAKWNGTQYISTTNSSITANNGLTLSGINIQLGGTLIQNTNIANAGFNKSITGIGNNGFGVLNPLSTIDNSGSQGNSITTINATTYTASVSDYTIILALNATQTLTLPTASAVTRRVYNIINKSSFAKVISSVTERNGNVNNIIAPFAEAKIQSDGTLWQVILGGLRPLSRVRVNSASGTGGNVDIIWANKEYDITNNFVNTTGIFTAPSTAYYQIAFQLLAGNSVAVIGSRFGAIMSKNNSSFGAGSPIVSNFNYSSNPSNVAWGRSETVFLNQGDTFRLKIFNDSATSVTLSPNANFDYLTITELPTTN